MGSRTTRGRPSRSPDSWLLFALSIRLQLSDEGTRWGRVRDAWDIDSFRCGASEYDRWLREHAVTADHRGFSRVHVWGRGSRVLGYVTLSGHTLRRVDLASHGRGLPDTIPAALVGRLALSEELRGTGASDTLIVGALQRAARSSLQVAFRYCVVQVETSALIGWYERFGFDRIADDASGRVRLACELRDVIESFSAARSAR